MAADAPRVLVLGGRGMLGSTVTAVLREEGFDVADTATASGPDDGPARHVFDATRDDLGELLDRAGPGWVVNAIGILKPGIDQDEPLSVARAEAVNAEFPWRLAREAEDRGQRVIHISTDAVFAGDRGPYDERATPDAAHVYGRTKGRGEASGANVLNLRCSLVGDPAHLDSLLGWALGHKPGSAVPGYTNHRWNGVSTVAFARVCAGAIRDGSKPPSPLHLVPADAVNKAELLGLAVDAFGRDDLEIAPTEADPSQDLTLQTIHPETVRELWELAGYSRPPTISEMIHELARGQGGR